MLLLQSGPATSAGSGLGCLHLRLNPIILVYF